MIFPEIFTEFFFFSFGITGSVPRGTKDTGVPIFAVDDADVNPNRIKTLLANDLGVFLINNEHVFRYGPRSLSRNTPYFTISNS